jgi:hypothetical protein
LWQHGPKQEGELESVVKWNPVDEKVNEDLHDGEKGIDNPVNQPLRVLPSVFRFDCLKRLVRRIHKSNDTAKTTSTDSHENESAKDQYASDHEKLLGNFDDVLCKQRKIK